jgi:hypothetical protein
MERNFRPAPESLASTGWSKTVTLNEVIDDEIFGNADVSHAHFIDHSTIMVVFLDSSVGVLVRSPYSGWHWRGNNSMGVATGAGTTGTNQ